VNEHETPNVRLLSLVRAESFEKSVHGKRSYMSKRAKSSVSKSKPKKKAPKDEDEFQLSEEEALVEKIMQRVADHVPDPEEDVAAPPKKRKASKEAKAQPSLKPATASPPVLLQPWHPAETTVLEFLIVGCLPVTQFRLDQKATAGQYKGTLVVIVLLLILSFPCFQSLHPFPYFVSSWSHC
jgi:hypothetical protein